MAKTSTTDPLRIDEIPLSRGGTLGLTLCPGKKQLYGKSGAWARDLDADLRVIKDWGARAVVTLMQPHELDALHVTKLADAVEALGMDWYLLPIRDGMAPDDDFERAWLYAGFRLRSLLADGGKLLLHCQGGLGRTGTIAARLLVEFDSSPEAAIGRVRQARPGAIESDPQERYLRGLTGVAVSDSRATRILGCLLGGAIGDAFGYEVEFERLPAICARFGPDGIREPFFHEDRLIVSDDTQMSLFTAEGLLRGLKAPGRDLAGSVVAEIRAAYLDWLLTQGSSWGGWQPRGRLCLIPALRQRRAPGSTCLSALRAGGQGTIEAAINDSKGCGGVMRAAPIGLIASWDGRTAFEVGARAAATTHGHPSGYLSAGAMAAIVRLLIGGARLEDAAEQAIEITTGWSGSGEIVAAARRALDLARHCRQPHRDAIRSLGEGWVGEETLAIGLYSALIGKSFAETLAVAVNHDGDSDSTASIAGQLYGAWKGVAGIPHSWVRRLDVVEPTYEVMDGLMLWNGAPNRSSLPEDEA